ncbi:thiamine phosphate synthase [Candidatus Woesearchaeota archaeon]|nr:thiamine phosphate synthase [Candidatus Woesearchaeota archaeon]
MRERLTKGTLYLVTESNLTKGRTNEEIVSAAIRGGVGIVQLREKEWDKKKYEEEANKLVKICHDHNVFFVVNDYPDIALRVGADGLHVGQEDMPLVNARAIAGQHIMIGKSTHSQEQALAAQAEGADYISIGPVFPTRKKPHPVGTNLIQTVRPFLKIPFVAIGGIKLHNLPEVLNAGTRNIAVISAIVEAEDVEEETRNFVRQIKNAD